MNKNNPGSFNIFLSHTSKDRGFSAEIYEHLRCVGIPVWFSPVEMPPTGVWYTDEDIETKLRLAMERCDAALVLVDEYALNSRWVNYEIKIAAQIKQTRLNFELVPIINNLPKTPLPNPILALQPIDFNRGYKTALLNLINRLGLAQKDPLSVVALGYAMAKGSRMLRDGLTLQTHLEKIGVPDEIRAMIQNIRGYLAPFPFRPTIQKFLHWLRRWCSKHSRIETVVEGNQWYSHIPTSDRYSLIFSSLPTSLVLRGEDDGMTPMALLLTIVPPGSVLAPATTTSILAQYGQDGSAYLWLIHDHSVYRYSMGSKDCDSILLSENRLMGASQLAMNMRNPSIETTDQMLLQMMMNKMGKGMIQDTPEDPDAKWLSQLLRKLKADGWEFPQSSQNNALWAHLTHGGLLIYKISQQTGISITLSQQIQTILKSAGAQILRDATSDIVLSFSALQSNEIANYLDLNLAELKQTDKN